MPGENEFDSVVDQLREYELDARRSPLELNDVKEWPPEALAILKSITNARKPYLRDLRIMGSVLDRDTAECISDIVATYKNLNDFALENSTISDEQLNRITNALASNVSIRILDYGQSLASPFLDHLAQKIASNTLTTFVLTGITLQPMEAQALLNAMETADKLVSVRLQTLTGSYDILAKGLRKLGKYVDEVNCEPDLPPDATAALIAQLEKAMRALTMERKALEQGIRLINDKEGVIRRRLQVIKRRVAVVAPVTAEELPPNGNDEQKSPFRPS